MNCLNCGYNLRHLAASGNCPECGLPIARSLQGNVLRYSNPTYVSTLYHGVGLVMAAALGSLLLLPVILIVYLTSGAGALPQLDIVLTGVATALSIVSLVGWWMFSAPDPAIMGDDRGDRPRQVVRVCVAVQAAAALASSVLTVLPGEPGLGQIAGGADIVNTAAGVAGFFASMYYLRWLSVRLPDAALRETASRYIWLLPLIAVLGACLLMLGPLIAYVLFLLALNRCRLRLKTTVNDQRTELLRSVIA